MTDYGYAHMTVANESGGGTRVSTSFYLDGNAFLHLYPAGETRPFLSLELGDAQVHIGPRANAVISDREVEVFRDLAGKAAALLAEVERLHAKQSNRSGRAAA